MLPRQPTTVNLDGVDARVQALYMFQAMVLSQAQLYTTILYSPYHYQILTLLSLSITFTAYITSNYILGGAVWSSTSAPNVGWTSVASDKSGKRLAAAQGSCCAGFIYTSTNG